MTDISNELYQRMHGFKTVQRTFSQEGKSDWYYIDPRYEEGDKRREIEVDGENSENPCLKEVLAFDVWKNPDEYYIWRTVGDARVRPTHEAHDGNAFNWHIPPETGHPGSEYNCRCSASTYSPKQHKGVMLFDLSGLTAEGELQIPLTRAMIENVYLSTLWEDEEDSNVFISFLTDDDTPYIFSPEMRKLLGYKESNNDYTKHNNAGGGIGALGMYQIRRDGLIDTGYLTKDNKWTGKNGINSLEDFLKNPVAQERILNKYMEVQYRYLSHFGETKYVGETYKGIKSKFKITNTGLLAAIHRTGINYMNKFFQNIEKNEQGCYYMNYEKIKDSDLKTKFLWIETRLREFEK